MEFLIIILLTTIKQVCVCVMSRRERFTETKEGINDLWKHVMKLHIDLQAIVSEIAHADEAMVSLVVSYKQFVDKEEEYLNENEYNSANDDDDEESQFESESESEFDYPQPKPRKRERRHKYKKNR